MKYKYVEPKEYMNKSMKKAFDKAVKGEKKETKGSKKKK